MLTIREAQMVVFRREALERFFDRLVQHLICELPGPSAAAGSEAGVRAVARAAIERAAQHGIESAGSVTVLAELLLQYGVDFQRSTLRAWIRKMLSNPDLSGDMKVQAIRDRLDEETGGRTLVAY
jgi:hypothetical protein